VAVALGLRATSRLLAPADAALARQLHRFGAGLFLVLGLLSTLRFATLYGEMAGDVYRRDVKAAQWIAARLPQGVRIANVATSVEYLTGHRNLNLHGVTSPAFFGNRPSEREANVFESLGRLPTAERPEYLLTSVSVQEANPTLREMVQGEPLYHSSSFSSDELLVFPMRWHLVGKNATMFLPSSREATSGLAEVDRLNVCDTQDERAHGYGYESATGGLRLSGAARIDSYRLSPPEVVIDAGRVILGEEAFHVRTPKRSDLTVVLRTAREHKASVLRPGGAESVTVDLGESAVLVRAEGKEVVRLTLRPQPGWDEVAFRIPAAALGEGSTRLEIVGRHASFYYWLFQ